MKLTFSPYLDPLLRLGYFPKELPPTFHTRGFADHVLRTGQLALYDNKGKLGEACRSTPATHNLGRPGQLRRALKIPNPFNQYELARIVAEEWTQIEKHIAGSSLTVSRPVADSKLHRAFVPEKGGSDLPLIRANRRAIGRYLLKTDIARFYHSIYTHSIPWALDGKVFAKANRSGGLGNEIDRALRNGQDGQTLGIPVGPDTSLIIAEIVATCIDRKTEAHSKIGFRFMDDFEMAFPNRVQAELTLIKIEDGLADFELAINPLKTAILPLPQLLDRDWTAKIRGYEIGHIEEVGQDELLKYFNMAFGLSITYSDEPVLPYALGRLRRIKVAEEAWADFQNLLFQCAVAEPASLPIVLGQLHRHREFGISEAIGDVLNEIGCTHSQLRHASEVAWALWIAIWFDVKLSDVTARAVASLDDPFVSLLALHARHTGVLPLDIGNEWDGRIKVPSGLYDRNWPLIYEGQLKEWLPKEGRSVVADDPHFGPLLAAGVSFHDQEPESPVSYLVDFTGYGDFQDISSEDAGDF